LRLRSSSTADTGRALKKKTTNREIGDSLARDALRVLRALFPSAEESLNSGALLGDGDIIGIPGTFLDAKSCKSKSFHVKAAEWDKVVEQAGTKIPVMVVGRTGDASGPRRPMLAVLPLEHLAGLLKTAEEHLEGS
jgi:hypothetical protein